MRLRRDLLWILTGVALTIGVWAGAAPLSFYESFPLGRGWVAADGPYNEHLIRDFGGLNLALALVTGVAALRMRADLIRLAAGATTIFGLPHFVYHATHLEPYGTGDAIANMVTLTLHVVVPLWLLARPMPPGHAAAGRGAPLGTAKGAGVP